VFHLLHLSNKSKKWQLLTNYPQPIQSQKIYISYRIFNINKFESIERINLISLNKCFNISQVHYDGEIPYQNRVNIIISEQSFVHRTLSRMFLSTTKVQYTMFNISNSAIKAT